MYFSFISEVKELRGLGGEPDFKPRPPLFLSWESSITEIDRGRNLFLWHLTLPGADRADLQKAGICLEFMMCWHTCPF